MAARKGSVLILGTSRIGAALAQRLAAKEFGLHFAGRDEATLKALTQQYSGSTASVFDASKYDTIEAAVKSAAQSFKEAGSPFAGLAYCVGSIPLKSLRAAKPEEFESTFAINVVGAAVALKSAAGHLAKAPGGGSAVFFSSIAATTGFPMHTVIAASKAGLEGFVRSAAAELSPGIRCNLIAPSLTDTPLAARLLSSDTAKAAMGKLHPLPRVGTADDQVVH